MREYHMLIHSNALKAVFLPATLAAALTIVACAEADAATATGSFNVQVTIAATCTVTSATALNFGTQGVLAAAVNQTSAITVTCTNTTPYNVALNQGGNR